jgi:hypothetical protein
MDKPDKSERPDKPDKSDRKRSGDSVFERLGPVAGTSKKTRVELKVKPTIRCRLCKKDDHTIAECEDFEDMTVDERWNLITEQAKSRHDALCFLCLESGHRRPECPSEAKCLHCKGKHNTLLHNPDFGRDAVQRKRRRQRRAKQRKVERKVEVIPGSRVNLKRLV